MGTLSPTTSTKHPRLLHTTDDFHTPPTTSTHHPRLPHTTYDLYTPPTTCTHPANVSPGLSKSLPAYSRLSRPPQVYPGLPTSILASPAYPERVKTINCLEIEGEYQSTLRCYVRRFLSDDSFAFPVSPGFPRLSWPLHVYPGLHTSIPAFPHSLLTSLHVFNVCLPLLVAPDFHTPPTTCTHPHVSPDLLTSLPTSPRLSRPTHVSPDLPTSLPTSPRLSHPPHVSPILPMSLLAGNDQILLGEWREEPRDVTLLGRLLP